VALQAHRKDIEVEFVDCSIGDSYLSLGRYEDVVLAYHKEIAVFKLAHGEGHTRVASVYVNLDMHLKNGRFGDSRATVKMC
jgi:hypothetical protein